MKAGYFSYFLDLLPAVCTVALMSIILVKFVWKEKKKKQNFSGRSVFITNCHCGLGVEIAKRLDKLGFTVFAGFSTPNSEAAQRLKYKTSNRLQEVEIDVTSDQSIEKAFQHIQTRLETPGLDCLVNNGSTRLSGKFEWHTTLQYRKAVDFNIMGMICVTKYFLPLLKPVKGRIINMSGIVSKFISPYLSINHALKLAINGFSESLRFEMMDFGITVSLIEQEDFLPLDINLMSEEDISDMWENLSEENKASYALEFDQWHLAERTEAKKVLKFEKEIVQKEIHFVEHAATSENPQNHYSDIPTSLKLLLFLQTIVPQKWKERAAKVFLKCKI